MNTHTHFEDLSTDIFFEIFDYLHALDIFTSFTSLNKRISSILQIIPLLISLDICDTIRDGTSIISLLFNQHKFINLESCTFATFDPSTKVQNVIKQIENLNRLVSFTIWQPNNNYLNENAKHDFTQIILIHNSSCLRSIDLHYPYHYQDIFNYTSIPSNVTSFKLLIYGSPSIVSIYSILSVLRLCHTIRYLYIILQHNDSINNSFQIPTINDNDLPILSQMIIFDLNIITKCDYHSISSILRCMPNLKQFYFTLNYPAMWPFPGELLDGDVWKQIFEHYLPCLSKFEFHMAFSKRYPKLDLDIVVNSFNYFVKKYSNWHMIIDRWRLESQRPEEYVMLRTLNYHKPKLNVLVHMSYIYCQSFQTRSTTKINDHHLFYPDIKDLMIYMTKKRPTVTWSSPLYPQTNYLFVEMPIIHSSWWNNLFNFINFRQKTYDNDAQQYATYLSDFVHLSNIIEIEFGSIFDISRWKDIQFILQACPNVIHLTIDTRLLISTKLIDNLSRISIFKQIKTIVLTSEDIYFPSNFALKFVQRFPSLNHAELEVFSFDHCVSVIDILLNHLKNLSYMYIYYSQDTLLDDPFSRHYIIEKRLQRFPDHHLNEQMVNMKNNGEIIEIWLS